jgi:mannose-6-phosphate isomerase-like protein (cupin superfamily)
MHKDYGSVKITPCKHVPKGWGHENWIVNKDHYCGKMLFFYKDCKCSWHYHNLKDEVFFLAKGKMIVYYSWGDDLKVAEQTVLLPGMKFEVPIGLRHQMYALEESHLYEFSTHHEDSDSVRLVRGD